MTTPNLPTFINSSADLSSTIAIGSTTEGLYLDFKGTIDNWNAPKGTPNKIKIKAQKELCRDVTQFANTNGGCLLIGVSETTSLDGIKVAAVFAGIDEPDKMREWIEQAITNFTVPSTFTHDVRIIDHDQGPTIAVNIPPHVHTVFVYDRHAGSMEVVRRTSHGKQYLNPDELERHMMNGSRAGRLRFEEARRASSHGHIMLEGGVRTRKMDPVNVDSIQLGTCTEHCFELIFDLSTWQGQTRLTLPYDLLRSVWVDTDGHLCVLLSIRILAEGGCLVIVDVHAG